MRRNFGLLLGLCLALYDCAHSKPKTGGAASSAETRQSERSKVSKARVTPEPSSSLARSSSLGSPLSSGDDSLAGGRGVGLFALRLQLCPRMRVSNAPQVDKNRYVRGFKPFVMVNKKVLLAVVPTTGACLSSGFGRRRNRLHKGVDFQSKPPSLIRAAAGGVIVEAGYRKDYGNYVLIAHGHNIFTRYAHLERLKSEIKTGSKIRRGKALGKMGNTADWKLPIHLHYELLVGDYNTRKKSFGLKPRNIFSYPYSQDFARMKISQ